MELNFAKLAAMPGDQIACINARMSEDCKKEEGFKIEADQHLRITQATQRQFENLCRIFST